MADETNRENTRQRLDESDRGCKDIPQIARSVVHYYILLRWFYFNTTELQFEWHKIRLVMVEMIHFIRQLEAYCRLEVIECSWKVLTDFLNKKEGDLDALIDAHRSYLERMTKKILLWHSKPGKEVRCGAIGYAYHIDEFAGAAFAPAHGNFHFHPTIPRSYGMWTLFSIIASRLNHGIGQLL